MFPGERVTLKRYGCKDDAFILLVRQMRA